MAYPPVIPPNNRQNSTLELDNHPSDHNAISDALTAILARLGPTATQELAYAEQTVAQSSIQTTTVDLTSLTITFTLATQRRVQLTASIWFAKNSPDTTGMCFAQIATGANVEVQGRGSYITAGGYATVTLAKTLTLAPGTYTYKCRASTGAGYLNTSSSTVEPSFIQAIDLGPA